jgi:hypothetical protein
MQSMQDESEPAAGCHSQAAGYADLEARGFAKMSRMQERRYAPPVRMIRLTEAREIAAYKWVHPDEER